MDKQVIISNEIRAAILQFEQGCSFLSSCRKRDELAPPLLIIADSMRRLTGELIILALIDDEGMIVDQPFRLLNDRRQSPLSLLDEFMSICERKSYIDQYPQSLAGLAEICEDDFTCRLLSLISEFTLSSDLYSLDMLKDGASEYRDPVLILDEIEMQSIWNRESILKQYNDNDIIAVYESITAEINLYLRRYFRSLLNVILLEDFGGVSEMLLDDLKMFFEK